MGQYMFTFS